jgi:transketolase N-terminal domain/subunit
MGDAKHDPRLVPPRRHLATRISTGHRHTSDARVVCLTSDGERQEGSPWQCPIFAAHHELNNLATLVDYNGFQRFGS